MKNKDIIILAGLGIGGYYYFKNKVSDFGSSVIDATQGVLRVVGDTSKEIIETTKTSIQNIESPGQAKIRNIVRKDPIIYKLNRDPTTKETTNIIDNVAKKQGIVQIKDLKSGDVLPLSPTKEVTISKDKGLSVGGVGGGDIKPLKLSLVQKLGFNIKQITNEELNRLRDKFN